MTNSPAPDQSALFLQQDSSTAALSSVRLGQDRPVDDLVHRLERADGSSWWQEKVLASPVLAAVGDPSALLNGIASLDQLQHLKHDAKRSHGRGATLDDRRVGVAIYLLAISAGVVHHEALISTQPWSTLRNVLLELASALPEPWVDLVVAATNRELN